MNEGLERGLAPRETKEPGPLDRLNRDWLWANTAQWTRSDETTSNPDIWAVFSTPVSRRRGVARAFASSVKELDGIGGLWITDLSNDLHIAIALDDPDLEAQVREKFIDLVCDQLDPSEGELFVFPSEQVPDWAQNGESLF